MSQDFSTIDEAVDAIAQGQVVIVMDDEDRENEGDFVCAAEMATTEVVNFMMDGRGLLCLPLLPDACNRLDLPVMVRENTAPLSTGFTISIDHKSCQTGITAQERSTTILAAVKDSTKAADFVRPGHVFPLAAKEGGVLRRAGHTEAAIDLARMAGLTPAGTICEVLTKSGDRANREELFDLARQFDLRIVTIEELIRYRRRSEKLVHREAEATLPTKFGPGKIVVYSVEHEELEPIAIIVGNPRRDGKPPLVRLHSSCFTGDVIASLRCDCGDQLQLALEMMSQEGEGVLVYLPQEGRGIGLVEKIKAYKLQDQGLDTVEANLALGHSVDSRDYGVGIQILKDLGLSRIRLLTNNPKKTDAFIYGGFDLEVVDQVPIICPPHEHNAHYLATKRDKMGHDLPEDG